MVMDAEARAVFVQVLAVARKVGRQAISAAEQASPDTTLTPSTITLGDVQAANVAIAAATAALASAMRP